VTNYLVGQCSVFCCRVAEKERVNKMSALNLASIFGPILMKLDSVRFNNTMSRAKFHCNRLTTVQDIQDYVSLIFLAHSNNNNNKHDNVYGAVIMAEPLREFTRFI